MTTYINPMSNRESNVSIKELIADTSRVIYDIDAVGIILNRVHSIILWYNLTTSKFDCFMGEDSLTDVTVTAISCEDRLAIVSL